MGIQYVAYFHVWSTGSLIFTTTQLDDHFDSLIYHCLEVLKSSFFFFLINPIYLAFEILVFKLEFGLAIHPLTFNGK